MNINDVGLTAMPDGYAMMIPIVLFLLSLFFLYVRKYVEEKVKISCAKEFEKFKHELMKGDIDYKIQKDLEVEKIKMNTLLDVEIYRKLMSILPLDGDVEYFRKFYSPLKYDMGIGLQLDEFAVEFKRVNSKFRDEKLQSHLNQLLDALESYRDASGPYVHVLRDYKNSYGISEYIVHDEPVKAKEIEQKILGSVDSMVSAYDVLIEACREKLPV